MYHFNHNVKDPRYLKLVSRATLWACGKLDRPAYNILYTGKNTITEIPFDTLIKITAKNQQDERSASLAVDGKEDTHWYAANNETPS